MVSLAKLINELNDLSRTERLQLVQLLVNGLVLEEQFSVRRRKDSAAQPRAEKADKAEKPEAAKTPTTPRAAPASKMDDPYYPYLLSLYDRINVYLTHKIISTLRDVEDRPAPIQLYVEEMRSPLWWAKRPDSDPLFLLNGNGNGNGNHNHNGNGRHAPHDPEPEFGDDFERIFNQYERRILLLGEPGAGKTITLLNYGREAVMRRMHDPNQPLPILLLLRTWQAEKHKTLMDWLNESYGVPEDAAQIIRRGEALLLLDGLDDVGGARPVYASQNGHGRTDPRVQFMEMLPENNQVLVTCRLKDYEDIGDRIPMKGTVTLKSLDDVQVRAYLAKQPDLMGAIDADAGLRDMLSTPLLLGQFAFAYQSMQPNEQRQLNDLSKSPGNLRDAVLRKMIAGRYEHESRKTNTEITYTLEEIYDVLGQVAVRDLMTAVGAESTSILGTIRTIMRGRSTAFVDQMQLLSLLKNSEDEDVMFTHPLLRAHFAFTPLTGMLSGNDENERGRAALLLGIINDSRAVDDLVAALDDESQFVEFCAAYALGAVGDKRAIEPLTGILKNSDNNMIKGLAVAGLMSIADDQAVDTLIQVLYDAISDLRRLVPAGIGQVAAEIQSSKSGEYRKGTRQGQVMMNLMVGEMAANILKRTGTPAALSAVEMWQREQAM